MEPRSPTPPFVRLRGLRAAYPRPWSRRPREVLHGIDLELEGTRRMGIVGPNGSGKSTLLQVLAGVDPIAGGTAEVLGGRPGDAAVRARVGFLPEESPFPLELHALAAIALLGSLKGLGARAARERGRAMLRRVGLGAELGTRLGRLSRGMLRRFGLAQALVHAPRLVLLDEPAAGLDAIGFVVLAELLDEAVAGGAGVVICSHLAREVLAPCERVACLVDGRLVADGAPAELLGAPDALVELYRRHAARPGVRVS